MDHPFKNGDIIIGVSKSERTYKKLYKVRRTWKLTSGDPAVDIEDLDGDYEGSFYANSFKHHNLRDYSKIKETLLNG